MPTLDYAALAFLDFLGFRQMVEYDAQAEEPVYLPKILDALDEMEHRAEGSDLAVTQFSDSVVLSSPFTPAAVARLIVVVRDLQRLLVERGILIRGGLAFGRHYEAGGRLFSKALVTAYELESARARFPRVLADPNLLDWCLNHDDTDAALRDTITGQLLSDRDGEVFVHYLDADRLDAHAQLTRATLSAGEAGNASVLAKAHWLIDYHEHVARALDRDGLGAEVAARFQPV
jgi:hypothetical protein